MPCAKRVLSGRQTNGSFSRTNELLSTAERSTLWVTERSTAWEAEHVEQHRDQQHFAQTNAIEARRTLFDVQ